GYPDLVPVYPYVYVVGGFSPPGGVGFGNGSAFCNGVVVPYGPYTGGPYTGCTINPISSNCTTAFPATAFGPTPNFSAVPVIPCDGNNGYYCCCTRS
ncbi:unnamed protein product, partial [Rotaria sordida]